jgi:cytochrome c556
VNAGRSAGEIIMSKTSAAVAVACALGAAGLASAQGAQPIPTAPETYVAARQASLSLSAAAFGGMKGAIDAGQEPKSQLFAARALARWAKTLPSLFPAGSEAAGSRARPELWSDRAGFEKAVATYAEATAGLQAAAEANDKAAFAAAWESTRQACGGCHQLYRVEPKRG